ncbi:MAG: M20 family metallo-hydrolase [Bacteroidales bacterium]
MEITLTYFFELLKKLISIPSFSREEKDAADYLETWLCANGMNPHRVGNNIWLGPSSTDKGKPTILLNAHIDTVKPSSGYTRDPFTPVEEKGRIYGLGSNDDGGSLVALLIAYTYLIDSRQPYNLYYSVSAEEEVGGKGGIECLFPEIGKVDLGVIGEPTGMNLAVAEKGLMVLDCSAYGKSGHAARNEGVNAIYKALPSIDWFRNHQFRKVSPFLGPVKMTVTQINAGEQHNMVPDKCSFVVDVRPNGMYSNQELLDMITSEAGCEVKARSTRLGSSHIDESHPIVLKAKEMGLTLFGSPTTSNQALCPFPTVKIGPGESARSHTADEFIELEEISSGAEDYIMLLNGLNIL